MTAGSRSSSLYRRACELMPAGVNSPVRAFRSVGGSPFFCARGQGCHLFDVDGHRLIDYVGSWGPLILGHAHPEVVDAVARAAAAGLSFGAPCPQEVRLAERITESVPHIEKLRFVSSGTEAVMSAVRLARGFTGRDLVVKFDGCYHGHADHLLVAGGSGMATFGTPSSAGVPESFTSHTAVLPLDDGDRLATFMSERGDDVAAILIEGVPANSGLLVQRQEFIDLVRSACTRHGAMMILDEVITGFRLGPNGAAARYGVVPDIATYGKVIGGGLPVGAYGGSAELMDLLAPLGPVYQAGTLSGNPVAMAAGATTLDILLAEDGEAFRRLELLGATLAEELQRVISKHGRPWSVVREGSILWLSLQAGEPPRRFDAIDSASPEVYAKLHRALLARDVFLAPSAYEVMFLSLAHDQDVIDQTIAAFDEALADL